MRKRISWPADGEFSRRYRFYALIWLAYLIYPLLSLFGLHSVLKIACGLLSLVLFVLIYVRSSSVNPPPDGEIIWSAAAIEAIGLAMAAYIGVPFLSVAVYAPLVLAKLRDARSAILAVALAVALMVVVGHAIHTPTSELLSLALIDVLSSAALRGFQRFIDFSLTLRRAQEEIAQMAKLEERARIARDLHDILGHSLSVVVLKSELARTLLGRGDLDNARQEIGELETVARAALSEVRGAVTGYRKPSLAAEVLQAPTTLATAGIRCDVEGELSDLSDQQESVLALILREAVTNVARHSAAGRCHIKLGREDDLIRLTIRDDGRAGANVEPGNGLQGMTERLHAAGGQLAWHGGNGFTLEVRLPIGR